MMTYISKFEIVEQLGQRWSKNGAEAFADYLEEMEEKAGRIMYFNAREIFSRFTEYESAAVAAADYATPAGWKFSSTDYDFANEESALFYLKNNTTVISFLGGVIVLDEQI